jgi:hypothetical protein
METLLNHFEFINSLTGNVICHLSVPTDVSDSDLEKKLAKRRAELAVSNRLYIDLIYWQVEGHVIR